jgi:DNA-binding Lrp family transcriptional regulator
METAHILVKYDDENDTLDDIKSIIEVKEIKKTFGAYNAVIKLEAESVHQIKKIMSEKIRNRQDILNTITLVTA